MIHFRQCGGLCGLGILAAWPGRLPAQSVATPPSLSLVQIERFHSAALGVDKNVLVYLPRSYATSPGRRYPVVYVLHGYGGNESDWISRGQLNLVADSAFGHGVREMILVMPDGDNGRWSNWSATVPTERCAGDEDLAEAAEAFCVQRAAYGDAVARDLVRWVDARYRTLADRAHRGLMGLSMGGTGALTLALTYPGRFSAAVAFSAVAVPLYVPADSLGHPAHEAQSFDELEAFYQRPLPWWRLAWGPDSTAWWRYDPSRAAARLLRSGDPLPALRLEVGRDDPLAAGNRLLVGRLAALGIPSEFLVAEGQHTWRFWRSHAGEALAWLGEHFGG